VALEEKICKEDLSEIENKVDLLNRETATNKDLITETKLLTKKNECVLPDEKLVSDCNQLSSRFSDVSKDVKDAEANVKFDCLPCMHFSESLFFMNFYQCLVFSFEVCNDVMLQLSLSFL
jgi:hypothetical protein